MRVFGIVSEYNPFHNGHKYQIDLIKKDGESAVVAVMSPNVVQRGDFAVFDKWTRVEAALKSGVDLVVELPSAYALATAEKFAFGAVSILNALGFVDFLSFGSESADLQLLKKASQLSKTMETGKKIKELLNKGISYPKARAEAMISVCPELSAVLSNPNDILGIEYLNALNLLNSKIEPKPILRKGTEHDSKNTQESFASASFLRGSLNRENLEKFTPPKAAEIYLNALKNGNFSKGINSLSDALILKLRLSDNEKILKLADVSEGLDNRILNAAKQSNSIEQLLENIKTKRYTMARIRRILMSALIDFEETSIPKNAQYIRVLGANQKGLSLLSQKKSSLECVTSLARARELSQEAFALVRLEEKVAAAFNLSLENKSFAKNEFTQKPVLIK